MRSATPHQIIVPCDTESFKKVRSFIQQQAHRFGFNRIEAGRLVLAADEVCSNIIKHTYHFEPNHKIVLSWHDQDDSVVLEIEDDSPTPYLPSPTDFDLPTKIRYRHTNGYGKHLLKQIVDDIHYETVPGSHNKVSLVKFRQGGGSPKKDEALNPYYVARNRALSLMVLFETIDNLHKQKKADEILKIFLYTVMGRLATQPVALMGPISAGAPFGVIGQIGLSKKIALDDLVLPRHGWVMETLWAQRGPFLADEFRKLKIPHEEMETLEKLKAAVLIPLFVFHQLRGILVLGPKRTGQSFSEEDIHLVSLLATHCLLLLEDLERGLKLSGGIPAASGGELRGAVRAAFARLSKSAHESHVTLEFEEGNGIPTLKMENELLHKMILTLLTHIVYLTSEGNSLVIKVGSDAEAGWLEAHYAGIPLAFEKGKEGYNNLIDQMMAGGLRLTECKKALHSVSGKILVESSGERVAVKVSIPLMNA